MAKIIYCPLTHDWHPVADCEPCEMCDDDLKENARDETEIPQKIN